MATRYNREDSRTVLPQIEKLIAGLEERIKELEETLGGVADYIVEEGETGDWTWRKWNSGRYEAECTVDYGTVSLSNGYFTINGSVAMYFSDAIPTAMPLPPHTLVSGSVEVEYLGNSTGYAFLNRTQNEKIQLARASSAATSVSHVILGYRVVNGTWK